MLTKRYIRVNIQAKQRNSQMVLPLPSIPTGLGSRIRWARQQWCLRQGDLQRLGGPSRITLIRLEQGKSDPENAYKSTISSLAKIFGCREQWLLTGEGEIWAEGITPPENLRHGNIQPRVFWKDLPTACLENTNDLGRWITEGPIDWAIVSRAIHTLEMGIHQDPLAIRKSTFTFSAPMALQVIYNYLIEQDKPLEIQMNSDLISALITASSR